MPDDHPLSVAAARTFAERRCRFPDGGPPKRAENTPAKMLSSTSALPSRIK